MPVVLRTEKQGVAAIIFSPNGELLFRTETVPLKFFAVPCFAGAVAAFFATGESGFLRGRILNQANS